MFIRTFTKMEIISTIIVYILTIITVNESFPLFDKKSDVIIINGEKGCPPKMVLKAGYGFLSSDLLLMNDCSRKFNRPSRSHGVEHHHHHHHHKKTKLVKVIHYKKPKCKHHHHHHQSYDHRRQHSYYTDSSDPNDQVEMLHEDGDYDDGDEIGDESTIKNHYYIGKNATQIIQD